MGGYFHVNTIENNSPQVRACCACRQKPKNFLKVKLKTTEKQQPTN
ncbi:hypothetical protein CAL7102_03816 [Dulcicalothrix desertica PCC 7102]|nr:hypothetical protein CAL7102_03816 [Dulcicalothrix desertica PCC 7102]